MDETLFPLPPAKEPSEPGKLQGRPRLKRANRGQIEMRPTDLESLLPEDHPTRLIWDFVEQLDLSPLYEQIRAVEGHPGQNAIDLKILMALWLFATLEGVGSARAHPGCPKSVPQGPNDIWAADYKGQFRLKNGKYCFPLTVSDLSSRYVLGIDAHTAISLEKTFRHFTSLFHTYGLPNRIRTDNGVPFASNALARLSQLSVWFIKLGIYPELIEPGTFGAAEWGA